MLVGFLARRQPRLGCLWLCAILKRVAKSVLREARVGLTALEPNAAAWTGIEQSFITKKPDMSSEATIGREDEWRLLFVTDNGRHTRLPVHPWKPSGETQLRDVELPVQQHAHCNCHCLEYESWKWTLTNGEMLEDRGVAAFVKLDPTAHKSEQAIPGEAIPVHCDYDLSSQLASEIATRGIFGWLSSSGYPAKERPIYQHSWIDIESTDEEEDDVESDTGERTDCLMLIDECLNGID